MNKHELVFGFCMKMQIKRNIVMVFSNILFGSLEAVTPTCFIKNVIKIFKEFTGKQLYWSLFFKDKLSMILKTSNKKYEFFCFVDM